MSFHVISSVIGLFRPAFDKVGRVRVRGGKEGRGGQICLPKPSPKAKITMERHSDQDRLLNKREREKLRQVAKE
jgi:hypothetical protein